MSETGQSILDIPVVVEKEDEHPADKPIKMAVYPSHCVNIRDLTDSIRELYNADKIRRPDEVEKYLRSRVMGIITCIPVRNENFYAIKMKCRDKVYDSIFWIDFRVSFKKPY